MKTSKRLETYEEYQKLYLFIVQVISILCSSSTSLLFLYFLWISRSRQVPSTCSLSFSCTRHACTFMRLARWWSCDRITSNVLNENKERKRNGNAIKIDFSTTYFSISYLRIFNNNSFNNSFNKFADHYLKYNLSISE